MDSIPGYEAHATALLKQYEALDFEVVHARILSLLPNTAASVLDIGAGSGRDAAHFVSRGHDVVAVEPTRELRQGAMALHTDSNIAWLDDRLPALADVRAMARTFDVVMLSAVWMHLDTAERNQGMSTLAALTHKGSRVFMSLRHGPVPAGRVMYDVSGEETSALGAQCGFRTILRERNESIQPANRAAGIRWTRVVLERK